MELECPQHHRLACDQMAWITQQLETHRELLASLRHGSVDYVLHLSVHSAAFQPLRIQFSFQAWLMIAGLRSKFISNLGPTMMTHEL